MAENYEKPKCGQLNEKSDRPVAVKNMTRDEINLMLKCLAASYGCDEKDITFEFTRIDDIYDDDRNDCLLLTYIMKFLSHDKIKTREIFKIKIPVPEKMRQEAEAARIAKATQRVMYITGGEIGTVDMGTPITPISTPETNRLKIKKPIRPIKK